MSLHGKTILLTRQPEQAGELVREIEARGGSALLFPTIRIVPPDSWQKCDEALERLSVFDGIVFTSPNAVTQFIRRAGERGLAPAALEGFPLWAVGETTAGALGAYGLHPTALPDRSTGRSLATLIGGEPGGGRELLLPRGDLASEQIVDDLRSYGYVVEPVVVYRTVPPSHEDAGDLHSRLALGQIDVVTFFSPSAARNFATTFGQEEFSSVLSRSAVAVIGPVTRDAVRALGLEPVVVASVASSRGMVDAIEQYFAGLQ